MDGGGVGNFQRRAETNIRSFRGGIEATSAAGAIFRAGRVGGMTARTNHVCRTKSRSEGLIMKEIIAARSLVSAREWSEKWAQRACRPVVVGTSHFRAVISSGNSAGATQNVSKLGPKISRSGIRWEVTERHF